MFTTVRLHSNKLVAAHGLKENRTNYYYDKYTTLVYNNESDSGGLPRSSSAGFFIG